MPYDLPFYRQLLYRQLLQGRDIPLVYQQLLSCKSRSLQLVLSICFSRHRNKLHKLVWVVVVELLIDLLEGEEGVVGVEFQQEEGNMEQGEEGEEYFLILLMEVLEATKFLIQLMNH